MPTYTVKWEVTVDADDRRKAVEMAIDVLRRQKELVVMERLEPVEVEVQIDLVPPMPRRKF
jgi:hypothetical protein